MLAGQVLERSVEHMRYLTESLSALEGNASTSFRMSARDGSVQSRNRSSPDSLVPSGYAIPATSGSKRKLDVGEDHTKQDHQSYRHSSGPSRSSVEGSPAGGKSQRRHARHETYLVPRSRLSLSRIGTGTVYRIRNASCSSVEVIGWIHAIGRELLPGFSRRQQRTQWWSPFQGNDTLAFCSCGLSSHFAGGRLATT